MVMRGVRLGAVWWRGDAGSVCARRAGGGVVDLCGQCVVRSCGFRVCVFVRLGMPYSIDMQH